MLRRGLTLTFLALACTASQAAASGWISPITLPPDVSTRSGYPTAAISGNGNIVVVDRGDLWLRPSGGTVSGPLDPQIGGALTSYSDAAINDAGLVVAAGIASGTLKIARKAPGASTFTPMDTITGAQQAPFVGVFNNGQSVVVAIVGGRVMAYAYDAAGGLIGAGQALSPTGDEPQQLQVTTASDGSVVALFSTDVTNSPTNHSAHLMVARRVGTGTFTNGVDVDAAVYDPTAISVRFDPKLPSIAPDGTAALAYLYVANGPAAADDAFVAYASSLDASSGTPAAGVAVANASGSRVFVPGGITPSLATVAMGSRTARLLFTKNDELSGPTNVNTVTLMRQVGTGPIDDPQTYVVGSNTTDLPYARGGVVLGDGEGLLAATGLNTSGGMNRTLRTRYGGADADFIAPFGAGEQVSSYEEGTPEGNGRGDAVAAVVRVESSPWRRQLAIWDGGRPDAGTRTVSPAVPTAGQPVTLTSGASDALSSQLTYSWDFDDGTTATGRSVTHTWATPGTKAVTVAIVDEGGNKTVESTPLTIAPDTTKPSVTQLKVRSRVRQRDVVVGTFSLSEAATVVVTIERALQGRGKPCKTTNRIGKRCTVYKRALRVAPGAAQAAGAARLTLRAKTAKRLAVGRYRVTVVATDAAGNASAPVRTTFAVR